MNLHRMALAGATLLCALCTFMPNTYAASEREDLTTVSERSGWKKTGRYEEVERLCPAFGRQWPGQVSCIEFGR